MSISNVGSVGNTQGNYSSNETQSIDQKIQQLQKQLEKVKSDDKMSAEEKDKRVKNLQDQIKRLQEQKTKLEQKKNDDVAESENVEAQNRGLDEDKNPNQNLIDILV